MAFDRTARHSVLRAGISIGSENVTAGTLTGRFIDEKDGKEVMVSNWHIFMGDVGETLILQPGRYDGGRMDDYVGKLKRYVPLGKQWQWPWWKRIFCLIFGFIFPHLCYERQINYVDAAVATFEPAKADRVLEGGVYLDDGSYVIPKYAHSGDLLKGQRVWKAGRTTGVTYGVVKDPSATIKVWYRDKWIVFEDVVLVEGVAKGGDSGSPVFWMGGDAPSSEDSFVGILFAGAIDRPLYAFCKNKYLVSLLRVRYQGG